MKPTTATDKPTQHIDDQEIILKAISSGTNPHAILTNLSTHDIGPRMIVDLMGQMINNEIVSSSAEPTPIQTDQHNQLTTDNDSEPGHTEPLSQYTNIIHTLALTILTNPDHNHSMIMHRVCKILADINGPAWFIPLLPYLDEEQYPQYKYIWRAIKFYITYTERDAGIDAIMSYLEHAPADYIAYRILNMLPRLASSITHRLIAVMQTQQNTTVRVEALRTLGNIRQPAAIIYSALKAELSHEQSTVQEAALLALRNLPKEDIPQIDIAELLINGIKSDSLPLMPAIRVYWHLCCETGNPNYLWHTTHIFYREHQPLMPIYISALQKRPSRKQQESEIDPDLEELDSFAVYALCESLTYENKLNQDSENPVIQNGIAILVGLGLDPNKGTTHLILETLWELRKHVPDKYHKKITETALRVLKEDRRELHDPQLNQLPYLVGHITLTDTDKYHNSVHVCHPWSFSEWLQLRFIGFFGKNNDEAQAHLYNRIESPNGHDIIPAIRAININHRTQEVIELLIKKISHNRSSRELVWRTFNRDCITKLGEFGSAANRPDVIELLTKLSTHSTDGRLARQALEKILGPDEANKAIETTSG